MFGVRNGELNTMVAGAKEVEADTLEKAGGVAVGKEVW